MLCAENKLKNIFTVVYKVKFIMIVLAGKSNIAVYAVNVLLYEINIPAAYIKVVCNKTECGIDGWQMSIRKHALLHGVQEISLEEAERRASVFISLEYDKLIRPERFTTANIFNIHFSLLPKYKGMYTSIWPLLNGDKMAGTTLHLIDNGIDTGDIIDQHHFSLLPSDCSADLYYKYIKSSQYLLRKNISKLLCNAWKAEAQSSKGSSYYSIKSIDFSNLEVELCGTAEMLARQIKAFSFRPYQLPKVNSEFVTNYKILEERSKFKPGAVLSQSELCLDISTIDYNVRLYKDCRAKINEIIKKGCLADLKQLIDCLPSIEDKDTNSWTPIMVACYNGSFEMVEYLIELGADVNSVDYKGATPLMYAKDYALKTGNVEIFELLLNMGANYDQKDLMNKSIRDYTENSKEWYRLIKHLRLE